MDHEPLAAPYEPDESAMQELFAPPPRLPAVEPVVCGHAFNGCSTEEADELWWASLRRDPVR
jgi:hypothetical protein